MDWNLVLLVVITVECLVILRGLVELSRSIEAGLADLDGNLAGALEGIVSRFSADGSIEPLNPIQAAIGQLIQSRLSEASQGGSTGIVEVMSRDPSGKFEKSP